MKIDIFYDKEEDSTKFSLLEDLMVFFKEDGINETYVVPSGFISDRRIYPEGVLECLLSS